MDITTALGLSFLIVIVTAITVDQLRNPFDMGDDDDRDN